MDFYRLDKKFPVTDYKDREVFVPNWVNVAEEDIGVDLEHFLVHNEMPYGIYCIEDDEETQYLEYFDKDSVPDAMFNIYFWNREPTCASFRIHFAEKELVGDVERFTGRVFSTQQVFVVPEVLGEMEYVGDWHPDDLIGVIYEQYQRELETSKRQ